MGGGRGEKPRTEGTGCDIGCPWYGATPPAPLQSTKGSKKIDPKTLGKPQPHTKITSSRFFVGPERQMPTSNK